MCDTSYCSVGFCQEEATCLAHLEPTGGTDFGQAMRHECFELYTDMQRQVEARQPVPLCADHMAGLKLYRSMKGLRDRLDQEGQPWSGLMWDGSYAGLVAQQAAAQQVWELLGLGELPSFPFEVKILVAPRQTT